MILQLAERTRDALLQVIPALIDGARGAGRIELLSASDRQVLAILRFSDPSSGAPQEGVLKFAAIQEDPHARASGRVDWAKIMDADNNLIFECDVSDERGDSVIKLNTDQIVAGGPVRITWFTLTIP